jgi:hypothetical protein
VKNESVQNNSVQYNRYNLIGVTTVEGGDHGGIKLYGVLVGRKSVI